MSVFTSLVTKTVPVPHDPGQSVTIRKLSPMRLREAQKTSQLRSIADLKEMGGPAFLKELQALSETDVARAVKTDPLLLFDAGVLMKRGLNSWTYPQAPSPETIEDLDDETQDFIAREILRLSKPSLFQHVEDAETDRKND